MNADEPLRASLRKIFVAFGIDQVWIPEGHPVSAGAEEAFILTPADFDRIDEFALHRSIAEVLPETKIAIAPDAGMVDLESL